MCETSDTYVAVVRAKETNECGLAELWWLRMQIGGVCDDSLLKSVSVLREEEVLENAIGANEREEVARV